MADSLCFGPTRSCAATLAWAFCNSATQLWAQNFRRSDITSPISFPNLRQKNVNDLHKHTSKCCVTFKTSDAMICTTSTTSSQKREMISDMHPRMPHAPQRRISACYAGLVAAIIRNPPTLLLPTSPRLATLQLGLLSPLLLIASDNDSQRKGKGKGGLSAGIPTSVRSHHRKTTNSRTPYTLNFFSHHLNCTTQQNCGVTRPATGTMEHFQGAGQGPTASRVSLPWSSANLTNEKRTGGVHIQFRSVSTTSPATSVFHVVWAIVFPHDMTPE